MDRVDLYRGFLIDVFSMMGKWYISYIAGWTGNRLMEISKAEAQKASKDYEYLIELIKKNRYEYASSSIREKLRAKHGINAYIRREKEIIFIDYGIEVCRDAEKWFILSNARELSNNDYELEINESEAQISMMNHEEAYRIISAKLVQMTDDPERRFINLKPCRDYGAMKWASVFCNAGWLDGGYFKEYGGCSHELKPISKEEFDHFDYMVG